MLQRGEIFQISRISAGIRPELYELVDLKNDKVPGRFYRQVLRPAPDAKDPDFYFEVEDVLKTRGSGKKKELFVKYLFYPSKFNEWVPASNLMPKQK